MLYTGIMIVCFSVFVITASTANGEGSLMKDGDPSNNFLPKTPPLSTTMECIINLTVQYFVIYSGLFVVRTVNDLNGVDNAKSAAVKALEMAKDSVTYAPMLCILFVGTRMRALQLTQNQGAPP